MTKYSNVMTRSTDLLTRWPALEVPHRRGRLQNSFQIFPGPLAAAIAAQQAAAEHAAAGLWRRDASVWSADGSVQQKIRNRLGWLDSPALMADALPRLETFASGVRRDGITDVVLLGMGGSSLAPEVLHAVLGVAPGWPRLHVLDSTDPAAVRAATTVPDRTLYLLASKSGTTVEPNSLAAYFRERLRDAQVTSWADHFVAITDEGTPLARRARDEGFRELFINPGDIGGRYSALSYFGLVPAALMGQNISALVGWGLAMLSSAEPGFGDATSNPAVGLGLAIGASARAGRDKLTLILPRALEPFGLWVEQLIAESTGKQGTGVVPIAGGPLAEPALYGTDRFFVRLRLHGSYAEEMRDTDVRDLREAAMPLAALDLPEPSALGAEFVRWEVATAVAGALLEIDPFDEPNVQQAKDATSALLVRFTKDGRLPAPPVLRELPNGITLSVTRAAEAGLGTLGADAALSLLREGDYFALLAYLGPAADLADDLQAFRVAVRDRTRAATMFGYGPRYLHSTGQLHKGGPNSGVFLLITATPREDLPIPDRPYTFGTLELAQAIGDFDSLDATGRRAVLARLPSPDRQFVRDLAAAMLARVRPSSGTK
jgi:glucose-6-phosphate isomerase